MEILHRRRAMGNQRCEPSRPVGKYRTPDERTLGQSVGGVVISDHTALQLAAVYGSVSIICRLHRHAAHPAVQGDVGTSTAEEMEPAPVIKQPWPEITQRDFITQGSASLLLRGNLFGKITARDNRLFPSQVQLSTLTTSRVRRLNNGADRDPLPERGRPPGQRHQSHGPLGTGSPGRAEPGRVHAERARAGPGPGPLQRSLLRQLGPPRRSHPGPR